MRPAKTSRLPSLENLPDDARVWIFGTDRPLAAEEAARLDEAMIRFLEGWTAHGDDLVAAFDQPYGRFLVVALDERRAAASGCSIDALVGRVRELEGQLGVRMVDSAPVWYRDGGEIRRVSRAEFREAARNGHVNDRTVVFDLTVERLGALRAGRWELPAGASWHRRLLPADSA